MLPLAHRIAFSLFTLVTVTFAVRGFYRLFLRVRRGRPDHDLRTNAIVQRAWYALRTTLTQNRVFRRRPVISLFHSFIFYAFVLYLLVNLVDAADGFVAVSFPATSVAGTIYGALSDAFSVLAIVGVLALVLRRFLLPSGRDFAFNARTLLQPAIAAGYIQRDSAIVSAFIVLHVGSRIVGNAARLAISGPEPAQPFGDLLSRALVGHHPMAWRIFGYWGALGSVLLFLLYFPYSKHVHLLIAPLKYFFHRDEPSGVIPAADINLDASEPELGASTLAELSWPRLLDAYACIQCNRCQDVCPASQTGKALSPAALEINKRMVLNTLAAEVNPFSLRGASSFERGKSTGPALLEAVISPEAVWACTTCGACMEVCPTQDEQMLDILDIRRNLVMLQGEFPPPLQAAFRGMARAGNPWAMARDKRMAWAEGLHVPTTDDVPNPDVLYWVGCAASYDPGAQKTARAVVQLLTEARVNFAVLGKRESCTGDSARRAGNELLYQELAGAAIPSIREAKAKLVLASCPHCVNIIDSEYPQLGGHFEVMHHTTYFDSLLRVGKLTPASMHATVTFHDPCYLGRHRGVYEAPRSVLKILSNDFVELDRNRSNSFCCGAGGAQFWKEEEPGDERISENRFREVQQTLHPSEQPKVLAVGCPFCKSMLQSSPSASGDQPIAIKDVAELLWEGVQRAKGLIPSPPPGDGESPKLLMPVDTPAVSVEEPAPVTANLEAPNLRPAPPDGTPPSSMQEESKPNHAQPSNAEPEPAEPSLPVQRKKWTPKAPSPTAADPEPSTPILASEAAEESSNENAPNPSPPARKKWQPKNEAVSHPSKRNVS